MGLRARAYLLECDLGLMLVDAGSPGFGHIPLNLMRTLGRDDLKLILITHAHLDHYGSAAALRRVTGAKIAVHWRDADFMTHGKTPLGEVRGRGYLVKGILPLIKRVFALEPAPPDILMKDGDILGEFGLNGRVLHTPGHTPGSSCWIVDDPGIAFSGDLVTNSGRACVQRFYAHDWSQIPQSLERLQAQTPEWVYTGHGARPIDGDSFSRLLV